MKQKITKKKIKNGIEVVFCIDKRFTTSTIQIGFKHGWRDDKDELLGLAHFFEHLVGKRTNKFKNKSELTEKIESEGIVANATTYPEFTYYYHQQTPRKTIISLGLLLESIYNTKFNNEDLKNEKEVVLQESRQWFDNDNSLLWHTMTKNLFPKSKLSRILFGTKETLGNISLEDFETYYKICKNPKNTIFCIAIPESKYMTEILKSLETFFKHVNLEKEESKTFVDTKIQKVISRTKVEKKDRGQITLGIGFKTKALNAKEKFLSLVLSEILTGGFSSILLKKLREEKNLIYWINFNTNFYTDCGLVYFETSCEKSKEKIVEKLILKEISNLGKILVQKNISDVSARVEFQIEKSITSGKAVDEIFEQEFYNGNNKNITPEDYINQLQDIKIDEIKKLCNELFKSENMSVVTIG